jgi:hypothetical protein
MAVSGLMAALETHLYREMFIEFKPMPLELQKKRRDY